MKTLSNYFQIASSHIECLEDIAWENGFRDLYNEGLVAALIINLPFSKDQEDLL